MTNEEIDKKIQSLDAANNTVFGAIKSTDSDGIILNKEMIALNINLRVIAEMLGEIAKKL